MNDHYRLYDPDTLVPLDWCTCCLRRPLANIDLPHIWCYRCINHVYHCSVIVAYIPVKI